MHASSRRPPSPSPSAPLPLTTSHNAPLPTWLQHSPARGLPGQSRDQKTPISLPGGAPSGGIFAVTPSPSESPIFIYYSQQDAADAYDAPGVPVWGDARRLVWGTFEDRYGS